MGSSGYSDRKHLFFSILQASPGQRGWYVAVNRFAPNEEDPIIRACVIPPDVITNGFIGSN